MRKRSKRKFLEKSFVGLAEQNPKLFEKFVNKETRTPEKQRERIDEHVVLNTYK